jgi:hypothetical protein
MGDNRNMGISLKAIAGRVQHGHREIDGRGFGFGVLAPDQAKRAAFTGAQVKDSARCARNEVGSADSPSLRWEMESAGYRWSRACSFEVQD